MKLDDVTQLANDLRTGRLAADAEYGVFVDDFDLTLNLNVIARWRKGYPGNREEPAEPAGYEIQRVMCGATDITLLLSQEDMERLEQELLD